MVMFSLAGAGIKLGFGSTASLDWEEEEEVVRRRRREELVRAGLQRKIESRKPPSVNEIPATDPVFHQVLHTYSVRAYD